MVDDRLRISPITPAVGAELEGVDLSQKLDRATLDAIYAALLEHLVIFFRDQVMTPESHIAFARTFGELDSPHHVYPHIPGYERIVLLENGPGRPPDTNDWHTDLTFKEEPPFASILWAKRVPKIGGDTLWASMYAAHDSLPEEIRTMIEPLEAVHDMGDFRNAYLARRGGVKALNEAMAVVGCAVHRMVKSHPVTGRRYLYVNRSFTSHVVGMAKPESDRLLAYLFDHLNRPEFQMRFRWRDNSLAMWDNRVKQHYAVSDYSPAYRCMHRITVVQDRRSAATTPDRRQIG